MGSGSEMIELLLFGLLLIGGLVFLVALPLMFLGMIMKLLFGLVMLPVRLVGARDVIFPPYF